MTQFDSGQQLKHFSICMLFCCKWLPPAIKTINFRSKTTSTFVWFVHRRTRSWNSRKDSENVLFVRSLLTVRDASWGCIELVLTWIKGHVKSLSRKESLIIGENINVGNSNYNHSAAPRSGCMVWEHTGARFDSSNYMNAGLAGVKNCIFQVLELSISSVQKKKCGKSGQEIPLTDNFRSTRHVRRTCRAVRWTRLNLNTPRRLRKVQQMVFKPTAL